MSADTTLVVIDAQIGVVGEAYRHDEVLDNINCWCKFGNETRGYGKKTGLGDVHDDEWALKVPY